MSEDVTLVHPDLPEAEYVTNPAHADVLAASGWVRKPQDNDPPAPRPAQPARTEES